MCFLIKIVRNCIQLSWFWFHLNNNHLLWIEWLIQTITGFKISWIYGRINWSICLNQSLRMAYCHILSKSYFQRRKKKIEAEPGTLPQLRRSYFVSIRNGLEVIKILQKEPHFQCGQIIWFASQKEQNNLTDTLVAHKNTVFIGTLENFWY